ncbi:MAG: transposase [Nitrospira sp.]|nr:transposase [Nitrospira sp.]
MPRIPRGYSIGYAYHILNRGNGGATVFHKDADYAAFIELLGTAKARHSIDLFGFCLMPNHFHVVVAPTTVDGLSSFMQWWMTSHVRRYHRHYKSLGHVWQGRFKSFPIQQDGHLLTVLRYVLNNPVRAKLVEQAGEWLWSSLRYPKLLAPLPDSERADLPQWLGHPLHHDELDLLRTCVNRQRPFGTADWIARIAASMGLESTLRSRGRPRHHQQK